METKLDIDQFLRSIAQPPFTEECRERAWKHQQHLDTLVDFAERLEYWRDVVDDTGIVHEIYYGALALSPNPKTGEDRILYARFQVNWYREKFIRQSKRVLKLDWKGFDDDPDGTAFIIESLDNLKTDLDRRLEGSLRPRDLLLIREQVCNVCILRSPWQATNKLNMKSCADDVLLSINKAGNRPLSLRP